LKGGGVVALAAIVGIDAVPSHTHTHTHTHTQSNTTEGAL
jgi:hypothetical protein